MRSPHQCIISARWVHAEAASMVREHFPIRDHGWPCSASVLISILFFAVSRITSIYDACRRLLTVPSDEAVRQALLAMWPSVAEMERRANAALSCRLGKSLRRGPQRLAIDLTEIPYHGRPFQDPRELRTGRPKHGTTHFPTYGTVSVVQHGERFTLAMTYVWRDDTLRHVVRRLLEKVRPLGIPVRYVLLDRAFYSLDVVRYLNAAHYAFVMPVVHRGRRAKDPRHATGTQRFLTWNRSGFSEHLLRNQGRTARVRIAVACDRFCDRRGRWRRRRLVFAFRGLQPPSCHWAREEYRRRFGIETSYQQMNQARIRTCVRNPVSRILLVAIGLILRNLWVWLHRDVLAVRLPNGKLDLQEDQMLLRTVTLCPQRYAEAFLGCTEYVARNTFGETPYRELPSVRPTWKYCFRCFPRLARSQRRRAMVQSAPVAVGWTVRGLSDGRRGKVGQLGKAVPERHSNSVLGWAVRPSPGGDAESVHGRFSAVLLGSHGVSGPEKNSTFLTKRPPSTSPIPRDVRQAQASAVPDARRRYAIGTRRESDVAPRGRRRSEAG